MFPRQRATSVDSSDPESFVELSSGADANNLLTCYAVEISEKLNIPALTAHLVKHGCITWDEHGMFKENTSYENNTKFIKHIFHRGVHAVNGFMKALQQSTVDGTGEVAHRELFNELRKGVPASRRESRVTLLSQSSTASVTASLPPPPPPPPPPPSNMSTLPVKCVHVHVHLWTNRRSHMVLYTLLCTVKTGRIIGPHIFKSVWILPMAWLIAFVP